MDTWKKFYTGIAVFVIVSIMSFFGYVILSPKHVHSYYLGSMNDGGMRIMVDIKNALDRDIILNGATYNEAIEMIKKLNATIPKDQ